MPYPCIHCGQMKARTVGSQCGACTKYKSRTGVERPFGLENGWKLGAARGEAHYAWKGDAANPKTKRKRAYKLYAMGPCVVCGAPGRDRHHKDEDTGNNTPDNIAILCRRCHMKIDGRLDALRTLEHPSQPPKPCNNCQRLLKPLRRGRCHACNEYWRRHGVERPFVENGHTEKAQARRETPCLRCGRLPGSVFGSPVRGYCRSCYIWVWKQETVS